MCKEVMHRSSIHSFACLGFLVQNSNSSSLILNQQAKMMHTLSPAAQIHLIPRNSTQSSGPRRPRFSALVTLDAGARAISLPNSHVISVDETKERIRKLFHEVDYSVSSYDTAWVAMVPDPHSSKAPLFPKCINWIIGNQLHDGSWTLPHQHSLLLKDVLSSTLACVLALKTWGIGEEQMHRGIRFIESNFASASEDCQCSPVGFDIIFPGMLEHARDLNLNIQLEPNLLKALHQKRDVELKRFRESHSKKSKAYLASVSEGLLKFQNWDVVMEFQRKNGSLFNSPSTTAAAAMNVQNPNCLNYLHSVIENFGPAVPTIYPMEKYARLSLIDNLESLGICRHFPDEIQSVLEDTYRYWQQGDEDIFAEIPTCALAFRLLRNHGYDISPDPLTNLLEEEGIISSDGNGYANDINALMQVYRASQMVLHENEYALKKQNLLSQHLLRHHILDPRSLKGLPTQVYKQVDYALKFPSALILPRVENLDHVRHYSVDSTRIQKTSYRSSNFSNEDLLRFAVKDFNYCQIFHLEEVKELERWSEKNRLHELEFARQRAVYCSFTAAATTFAPELYEARMSLAQNSVLATVVDDFFDVGGSMEEIKKLIELVEKWDVNISEENCSEPVKIIFSALHSTISEIGEKAVKWQGRNVTRHVIEIWLDLLYSMLQESEWTTYQILPTLDEYMEAAHVSFAMGPVVIPALYFVSELSDEVARGPEMRSLHKLLSYAGRYLNDIRGFEREKEAGKPNAVSLRLIEYGGSLTEEAAFAEVKALLEKERTELLRVVLQKEGSVVPRACKDAFWTTSRMCHNIYFHNDGYSSQEALAHHVQSIVFEPLPSMDCE